MKNTTVRKLMLGLIAICAFAGLMASHGCDEGSRGDGATRDKVKDVDRYRKAAAQGDLDAQVALGKLYYKGDGVEQNKAKAVEWFRKAAEQNHACAQVKLGACYFNGEGVAKDDKEAVMWFLMAAEQGDVDGQVSLGMSYLQGLGVDQDEVEAEKWFRKAAEQGVSNSELFKEAQQGDAECQSFIGTRYLYVEKDTKEAAKWYRMAAEQGYANAQYALGMHYLYGAGVDKDEYEAVKWLQKAAEQGLEPAKQLLDTIAVATSIARLLNFIDLPNERRLNVLSKSLESCPADFQDATKEFLVSLAKTSADMISKRDREDMIKGSAVLGLLFGAVSPEDPYGGMSAGLQLGDLLCAEVEEEANRRLANERVSKLNHLIKVAETYGIDPDKFENALMGRTL